MISYVFWDDKSKIGIHTYSRKLAEVLLLKLGIHYVCKVSGFNNSYSYSVSARSYLTQAKKESGEEGR